MIICNLETKFILILSLTNLKFIEKRLRYKTYYRHAGYLILEMSSVANNIKKSIINTLMSGYLAL